MIDEARAHGLQSMYQAGAAGALPALTEACVEIAVPIATAMVRSMRLPYSRDRIEEIAHDAASKLVERYLRETGFHVRRFSVLLKHRVRDELFVSPRQKQRTFEAKLVFADLLEPTKCADEPDLAREDPVVELGQSHRWGKKAVADLCRSRSYRQAVRRIAAYVERRWIYDHADELHQVYRALHREKGQTGGVRRSGLEGVRGTLLRRREAEREQSGE